MSKLVHNGATAQQLVGFKIIDVIEDDGDEGFFAFQIKKGKTIRNVWVLRDEEGNGPGCLTVVKA